MTLLTASRETLQKSVSRCRYLSSGQGRIDFVRRTPLSTRIYGSHSHVHSRSLSTSTATEPSGSANNNNGATRLPFSASSLGLERSFITPAVLANIRQLPEVETAWNQFPSLSSVDNLSRAALVFESYKKGGSEHLAVCALLAECQQRLADYEMTLSALGKLQELCSISTAPPAPATYATEDVVLAQAKVQWTRGEFQKAMELCDSIIRDYNDLEESFPTSNLHLASAMTGKALSQLAAMENMDNAYSVRDFFRITIKFLERHPPESNNTLPQAAAYSNNGIAEAVYAIFLQEKNNVSVPMDAALRTWYKGLQKAELSHKSNPHPTAVSKTLQANIQANLAWGVLNYEQDRSDRLSKASEYAGKALAAHDASSAPTNKEGLRRVLSVVASCYQEADQAVTTEGLFKSAIDKNTQAVGTLSLLELRDAYTGYAGLCRNWEKREGDAKKLDQKAQDIEASLPDGWKGKSGIHSALWWWTPSDFL
jgi:hypothetical protein